MDKLAGKLTDYIVNKGMIDEADYDTYKYGFLVAVEKAMFGICCLIFALILGMVIEGILFFTIFIPLRSYAGGLHFEKYGSCFIMSCLIFLAALLTVKFFHIPTYILLPLSILLIFAIYFLYPVENPNRPVDSDEDEYFRKRLKRYIAIDLFIIIILLITKRVDYLLLVVITLLMIMVTMVTGKIKTRNPK